MMMASQTKMPAGALRRGAVSMRGEHIELDESVRCHPAGSDQMTCHARCLLEHFISRCRHGRHEGGSTATPDH